MEIAEFLLARIAEDEAVARRAHQHWPWGLRDDGVDQSDPVTYRAWEAAEDFAQFATPARVLAECEAKRRIVEELAAMAEQEEAGYHDRAPLFALDILRLLALPYADHEDYQQDWKP